MYKLLIEQQFAEIRSETSEYPFCSSLSDFIHVLLYMEVSTFINIYKTLCQSGQRKKNLLFPLIFLTKVGCIYRQTFLFVFWFSLCYTGEESDFYITVFVQEWQFKKNLRVGTKICRKTSIYCVNSNCVINSQLVVTCQLVSPYSHDANSHSHHMKSQLFIYSHH